MLGGASSPAVAGRGAVQPTKGELSKTLSVALVAAGLAAAIVFVAFTFLPFLGAPSGALAAFVSTFITALVLRRR